jgi:AAHS family 4-hydroxybenzoate transporter-like MFS transporter
VPLSRLSLSTLTEREGLSALTKRVLILCFLLMVADNYDNTAISFVMPRLLREWHLDKLTATLIIVAGLLGLMVGSILFGWLGDLVGRKRMIIAGLVEFGLATLASMFAQDAVQLMALRFVAGLGIGGALPNGIALTNEYSPRRLRVFVVAAIFAGYTLGGSGGGFVAAWLMPIHGWPVVFLIGGVMPLLLAAVLAAALPESIRFLALHPHRSAEATVLARRMRPDLAISPETQIVEDQATASATPILADLFAGPRAVMTPLLWLLYIANSMAVFGMTNWLPYLIESSGLPPQRAALVATLWSIGGTVGGLFASRFVDRLGLRAIVVYVLLGCPLVAMLGVAAQSAVWLFVTMTLAGFFVVGTQNSLHGISGSIYPTRIRSNGVGWALGIAKIGSISGPFLAGVLLANGLPVPELFVAAAMPLVVAFVSAFLLMRLYNRHVHGRDSGADAASPPTPDAAFASRSP